MRKWEKVGDRWYKSPEEFNFEWVPNAGLIISVLALIGLIFF